MNQLDGGRIVWNPFEYGEQLANSEIPKIAISDILCALEQFHPGIECKIFQRNWLLVIPEAKSLVQEFLTKTFLEAHVLTPSAKPNEYYSLDRRKIEIADETFIIHPEKRNEEISMISISKKEILYKNFEYCECYLVERPFLDEYTIFPPRLPLNFPMDPHSTQDSRIQFLALYNCNKPILHILNESIRKFTTSYRKAIEYSMMNGKLSGDHSLLYYGKKRLWTIVSDVLQSLLAGNSDFNKFYELSEEFRYNLLTILEDYVFYASFNVFMFVLNAFWVKQDYSILRMLRRLSMSKDFASLVASAEISNINFKEELAILENLKTLTTPRMIQSSLKTIFEGIENKLGDLPAKYLRESRETNEDYIQLQLVLIALIYVLTKQQIENLWSIVQFASFRQINYTCDKLVCSRAFTFFMATCVYLMEEDTNNLCSPMVKNLTFKNEKKTYASSIYMWGQGQTIPVKSSGLISGGIRVVECGSKHIIVITNQSLVLTFGSGSEGQLGHGDYSDKGTFAFVSSMKGKEAVLAAGGGSHTIVVTSSPGHQLWVCGSNQFGQLGLGFDPSSSHQTPPKLESKSAKEPLNKSVNQCTTPPDQSPSPSPFRSYSASRLSFKSLKGKKSGSGIGLTRKSATASPIEHANSADSAFNENRTSCFTLVPNFPPDRVQIVIISCGDDHSAALTNEGSIYTWGKGLHGRLGHGNENNINTPTRIAALQNSVIVDVACGESHTICCSVYGKLFSFGKGLEGQLGHGDVKDRLEPSLIQYFPDNFPWIEIQQISAGFNHSAALTSAGLFLWGWGEFGQLGFGDSQSEPLPKLLKIVQNQEEPVSKISCGAFHTALLTNRGLVFTFGGGNYGQLGHGDTMSQTAPYLVHSLKGNKIRNISCGFWQTVAVE